MEKLNMVMRIPTKKIIELAKWPKENASDCAYIQLHNSRGPEQVFDISHHHRFTHETGFVEFLAFCSGI